jgi:hypothetical protein
MASWHSAQEQVISNCLESVRKESEILTEKKKITIIFTFQLNHDLLFSPVIFKHK